MRRVGGSDSRTVARLATVVVLLSVGLMVRPSAAQCPDGSPPPCRAAPRATAPVPNSLAVLYFDNLSGDTADAYLADGLTEEITDRLGDVEALQVKSRNAVRRFRGAALGDLSSVGGTLRVRYLVEGSVRRSGERLRVSVRLVRAENGFRVWGENYDRATGDLLALQEDIAREVTVKVAGRLAPGERAALTTRPTRSPVAYDHFVKGNYYLAQRTARAVARAIDEYQAAVRLDPGFSRALARIAYGYALFLDWGWEYPAASADTLLARGSAAADHALELDSTSSDNWMARAYLLAQGHPHTLTAARDAFERAVTLDPGNAEAQHQFGSILVALAKYWMAFWTPSFVLSFQ